MPKRRHRVLYAMLLAVVILAGLLSRSRFARDLPSFLSTYAGDTLWALAMYLALGFLFPAARTAVVAGWTLALAFGVEFSQLHQAEWIHAIRRTRIGALFLGVGFQGSDLACYTVGCLLGAAGELLARRGRGSGGPRAGAPTQGPEAESSRPEENAPAP